MPTIDVNGKSIEVTDNMFMVDATEWNEDIAKVLAEDEGIEMTQEHWDIINMAREHFLDNGVVAEPRAFSKIMKQKYGKDRSDQKYIYSLFPTGLIKCANKVAGLPRPKGCS